MPAECALMPWLCIAAVCDLPVVAAVWCSRRPSGDAALSLTERPVPALTDCPCIRADWHMAGGSEPDLPPTASVGNRQGYVPLYD